MDPGSTITKTIFGDPGHKFIDLQVNIPSEGTHTFTLKVKLKPEREYGRSYITIPPQDWSEATMAAMYGGNRGKKRTRRRRRKQRKRRSRRQGNSKKKY